jgi:hypothetical protein
MSKPMEDGSEDTRLELDVYKAALDFTLATSRDTWTRFTAMLVAHSILLAVSANLMFGASRALAPGAVPAVLLLAGFVVCFAWWAGIERGFRYQDRYLEFAKRIEEKLFPKGRQLLVDGAETKMGFPSCLRGRHAMRIVVFTFFFLYGSALALLVLPCLVH